MRPPEPDFLIEWRQTRNTPHCCHTCAHYNYEGWCRKFKSTPPAEFANTRDACESWEDEIPF